MHSLFRRHAPMNLEVRTKPSQAMAMRARRRIGHFWLVALAALVLLQSAGSFAASRRASSGAGEASPAATFAPVDPDHPLAGIWNDPDFARRLAGSYGFLSEAEPRMS